MLRLLLALTAAAAIALTQAGAALAQPKPELKLGFKELADLIPDVVGEPLENERYYRFSGESLQPTTRGLLVWRKHHNITTFTDGARSWVYGPYGLKERANDERFVWEPEASPTLIQISMPTPGGAADQKIPFRAQPARRPATGSFIRDSSRGGLGELTLENGLELDAVAILASPASQPLVSVYIRAVDSYTIKWISDGSYLLYVATGEVWDEARSTFIEPHCLRFEKPLTFQTAQLQGGTRYSAKQVTLHSTPGGSAVLHQIGLEEFPPAR